MRFIIWGAGVRGRRVRYFLGNRAVAYIDQNVVMQGEQKDELPVISFEEYLRNRNTCYRDAWIIISPGSTEFIDGIVHSLDAHGIIEYFKLQDAIASYYEYDAMEMIHWIERIFSQGEEIGLVGLNCFHADIYMRLSELGVHPVIWIPQEKWNEEMARCEKLSGWDIRCLGETDRPKILDDAKMLANLTSTYETPEMEQFHNMYKGRRCFVVATGPSLRMEDLETLHNNHEICISMNGIFHCFDQVKWRPDFFMMTDRLIVRYQDVIEKMDVPYKIISDSNLDFWKREYPENVYRMHVIYGHSMDDQNCFSDDFRKGCYGNFNVTNACMQFAAYLGCKNVYLLGVDFSQLGGDKEQDSHFSKEYYNEVKNEDCSNLYTDEQISKLMLRGYQVARHYADTHPPFKIYNATRGGKLEVFERVDFDSLF